MEAARALTVTNSTQEQTQPMDIDSNSPHADAREGRKAMLEDTRNDTNSDGEVGGSGTTPAPSELARSLGHHRSELRQIRHRLHGHGNSPA
jgi:hypothetical protein